MAIKTDNKPNPNIATEPPRATNRLTLTAQEIAKAIQERGFSGKAFADIPGKGIYSYEKVLDQARIILERTPLSSWSKLDNATLARRLIEAIPKLSIFQPIIAGEESVSTMAETPTAPIEEEPLTMSDKSPSNPLSSFSGSNQQGSSAPQRVVVSQPIPSTKEEVWQERVKQMEAGAEGPASEKINRMREETGPATKKIDEMRATDNPVNRTDTTPHREETPSPAKTSSVNKPESNPTRRTSSAPRISEPRVVSSRPSVQTKPFSSSLSGSIGNMRMPSPLPNLTSSAGRFFKTNFGKFLTPGNASRIGSSIIGGFGGMGVAGVAGAGAGTLGGFFAPEILKAGGGRILSAAANKGVNSFMNLSNGVTKASGRFSKVSGSLKKSATTKRVAFGLLGLFFAASLLMSLVGGASSQSGSGGSQNQSSSGSSIGLDYSIPFRNASIVPLDVKNQVTATFPQSKIEYWDIIVQRSVAERWNPAFVLTLWIEETGASQTTVVRNGGGGIAVGGNLTMGHLGCAPTEDQTIDQSLDCLFKNFNQYSNDQFAQFMARYSGGPANSPFSNNPNFPGNIKHWYSILVPSGNGALTAVSGSARSSQVTTPSSCPVPNGTINCGSQMTPVNGPLGLCGHCGAGYNSPQEINNCQSYPENKYAIDIATKASETVFFPTINNHNISWRFVTQQAGSPGYIQIFAGEDTSTQDKYSLQIHHTESGSGNPGSGKSGEYAAASCATCGAGHVHVQLRNDSTGQWLDAAQTLCR